MLSDKISSRIRELRIKKGLTQEELADKADIDVSYIGKIERGQNKNISIDTLDKIINSLEMDYDDFFSFSDSKNDFRRIQYEISISNNKEEILKLVKGIINLNKGNK